MCGEDDERGDDTTCAARARGGQRPGAKRGAARPADRPPGAGPAGRYFAFGILLTSERLMSIPSIWKCGMMFMSTRKNPGLSGRS